ncbi:dicarboxylate/amino acid:cation symporter [Legionella jordanis]|uniref:Sodium:dicarboxylate symporter protein n=1 Tax=Legionella jordanis TaxID=456 RepID=A0A0W0VCP7_9GAMM|nr:dicarboxylate/amino acid:cation symporter [Legionella jordanis]KTD17906.1 sodium:dicarboxylate symporter protein [Legionella jordanis]RMX02395.1 dicarboxylate/amino acid:cation symporter [Legionella jordanis]RMX21763.1 dicarboxylate/amino acid:cation symporter [Legionella jordanis]VEH14003.1 sodium:dicarboxylate symporter protein [Legionella jordanis]HAT8713876.1 cation:dicarboxylase symporter family transporter [Legionella jordanis]
MSSVYQKLKPYVFPGLLLAAIILGGCMGYFFGEQAKGLKPLGDIFINLIFTAIVPLIFFSVSSAIVRTGTLSKLGKMLFYMMSVFLFTGIIAAFYMLVVVELFPPAQKVSVLLAKPANLAPNHLSEQIVGIFSVSDLSQLLSPEHILPLIIFSILLGLSILGVGEKGRPFANFLQAGEAIFMRFFSLIMWYAPIGFFAYFAVMLSDIGPKLIESYLRIFLIYYAAAIIYFVAAFTVYAYLAAQAKGVKLFWRNVFLPLATSIATCSSAASIPANLAATRSMRVSPEVYETVIPMGAMIHKDGSVLGAVVKIAFLFGLFHLDFSGVSVILTAVLISLLVGTVMGAIPSGGMLGELLILSVYGFPPSVLLAVATISILIDPLATMLNVTGDAVSSMMVARLLKGKSWFAPAESKGL